MAAVPNTTDAAHSGHGANQANLFPNTVSGIDSQGVGSPTTATTAVWNSYQSCGTITRANVGLAAPADLDDIFKSGTNYRDMTHLLTTQMELATCGARQYGMYDWLVSSSRSVGDLVNSKKIQGSGFEVDPFILAAQKDVIKDSYWIVDRIYDRQYKTAHASNAAVEAAGADEALLTVGNALKDTGSGTTDYDYNVIKVHVPTTGNQPISASYFAPGMHFHMFAKDASGTAWRLEWKVIQAVGGTATVTSQGGSAGALEYIDIECDFVGGKGGTQSLVKGSAVTDWNADFKVSASVSANAPSFKLARAGGGVVVSGTNNVNDFESWCENRPALNTLKHVPFWYQTSRYTLCVDQFYKEWLERMMRQNTYFQRFGDVPLAERNKQLGLMFQKEWVNSFFWGQPLNGQTLAGYQGTLEQVNSFSPTNQLELNSGMEGKLIGYRANATGIYRQLKDTDRVTDKQGGALVLEADLFDKLFEIVRSRKDQGKPADSIDIFTDTRTARQIWRAMIAYYKKDGSLATDASLSTTWDMGQKNLFGGFYSQSYTLHHPVGVQMNIITNEFFDDMATVSKFGDDNIGAAAPTQWPMALLAGS